VIDADCPTGLQCVSQLCKACELDPGDPSSCLPCQPGSTCTSGNQCDYDVFVCVECREDADCGGADVCQLGDCAPPCFGDLDCPAGAVCNVGSNHCVP
jgi:Cys-rich repeat protein